MNTEKLEEAIGLCGTPSYIFDLDVLKEHVNALRRVLGRPAGLCFAVKANPFLAEFMAGLADRLEICSIGEFHICRSLEIPPEKMMISGVLKKETEIREILEYCRGKGVYSVESFRQFRYLAEWSDAEREPLSLCIRLSAGDQFGVDWETLLHMAEAARLFPYLTIAGIHFFSGTRKKSVRVIIKELRELDARCLELEEVCGYPISLLEYGPGFSISYFDGQEDTLLRDVETAAETVRTMQWQGNVVFEMGRALAASCGYYLTQVYETKQTGGYDYCIVDGGLHQMNYDGQILGMYPPHFQVIPDRRGQVEREWTVCGALCTSRDVLIRRAALGNLKKGDVFIFKNVGAYSATEGMALFLSRELPAVHLYDGQTGWRIARKRTETVRWNMNKAMDKEAAHGTFDDDSKRN